MLLDTNAISAWAKQDAGLLGILRSDRPWYLPSIALGEYRFGLMQSQRRVALEAWLNEVEEFCTTLSPDGSTARLYAQIRSALHAARRPIPYHDIWIGALAIQHGIPVVSRDLDFDSIEGVQRIGW